MSKRLIVCLLATLPVAAQSLPDVLGRLDKSAKTFKGMAADIRQTAHTAIVNDDSTENGTIKLKRGKETNFIVDFTSPDAKTVSIADGEVSVYIPKAKTVQIYDLRNKRAALEQALLLGFGASSAELQAAYEISYVGAETLAGQPTNHIKLVPKSKEVLQNVKSAELWISDNQGVPIQQKVMTSGNGDYNLMQYANVRLNPSISDKELKLNLPKGVQVSKVGK